MPDLAIHETTTARSNRNLLRWGVIGAGIVAVGLGAVFLLPRGQSQDLSDMPTARVQQGQLVISVSESGTIRPRDQIILKNELDDPATIVSIVNEGTEVKKGDLLVELDVSTLKTALVERRIRVQSAEAGVIYADENYKIAESQGQSDIEAAELAHRFAVTDLDQYLKGLYPKSVKEAEAAIAIAEEELTRAQETLNWSNVLFEEKYLSRTALQQDELALKKAQLAVELAKADLDLLQAHTHTRQIATYEAAVKQTEAAVDRTKRKVVASLAQAEADLKAKRALLEEEKAELEETESEISKSKLYAAVDGMVLYASSISDRWDDDEAPIGPGATVDERGEIVYLPTTGTFNIDVKILEVDLQKVALGQDARIIVDAMPGRVFWGKISSIAPLPDAESRFLNPNLKLYNAVIDLTGTDPALRNGMSCRAEMYVATYADALHVPIQCVTRVNGKPSVHVLQGNQMIVQPIEIGLDNGRFVHVLAGLEKDQVVLLTPPLSSGDQERAEQEDSKPPEAEENRQEPETRRNEESNSDQRRANQD